MSTSEILRSAGFPGSTLVLDFETYFSKDYSLSDLSIVEYVTDSRFEFTGLGIKLNNDDSFFVPGPRVCWAVERLREEFGKDLGQVTVVAKNCKFDILILSEVLGVRPKYVVDVEDLTRYYDSRMRQKLEHIAKFLKLEDKGDTTQFKGQHADEIDYDAMKIYCLNDVDLEYQILEMMLPAIDNPEVELLLMQHTLNLYLDPPFELDVEMAKGISAGMQKELRKDLLEARWVLEYATKTKQTISEILRARSILPVILKDALPDGEEVPMKQGKKKMIPALAQEDIAFQLLLVHPVKRVRDLCTAKAAVTSWPLHRAKIESIIKQAECSDNKVRVPIKFYGAHCLPGHAEVLTRDGWTRLDAWNGGEIMQWYSSGDMCFANAAPNVFHDCGEPMVNVDSPYIKASFTMGHTIPRFGSGSKAFMPCAAADLSNKCISYLPISGVSGHPGGITSEEMRVLVAVQADGHWVLHNGRELRLGLTKFRKKSRLRQLFKQAKITYRECEYPSHPGETTFKVRWKDLPPWLTPDRKVFGPWLLDSTPGARLAFIKELRYWDGHKSGNLEYYSALDENHEWVATIAHLVGKGARRGKNRVTIIRETRDPQRAIVTDKHVSYSRSMDTVYCPTTITGYFLMRQKGTISITGNTGRWSGTQGVNLLNLGGKGRGRAIHPLIGKVRHALLAPKGRMLTIADSCQIEARELAWISGQTDLTKGFADGEDIYSVFATRLFGEEVRKPKDTDSPEAKSLLTIRRGFGKDAILGCIAAGSPVLTKEGWKVIERIAADDLLWDGRTWVKHGGLVDRGIKSCVRVRNIWMTPEHEVLTEGGWTTAAELSTSNLKSEVNMVNSPLQRLCMDQRGGLSPSNAFAPVVDRLLQQETVWSVENLHAVMCVLKRHPGKLRAIRHLYPRPTRNDFLIEFVRSLAAVKRNRIRDMVKEVSEYGPIGSQIESLFLSIWRLYQGGITRALKSTELKMIGDTNLVILGSPQDQCKCGTQALTIRRELELTPSVVGVGSSLQELASHRSSVASTVQVTLPTYDILLAGPRKRFQVGNIIASNCGYGMGTNTFITRCKQNASLRPLFDSGEYDWDFIDKLIKTYRTTYECVPEFWRTVEKSFRWVTKYPREVQCYHVPGYEHEIPALRFFREKNVTVIQLPSGRRLFYRNATVNRKKELKYQWGPLWGGSLTENIIQAICRDLLGGWLLECERNDIHIILHSYDELVGSVKAEVAEESLVKMIEIMNTGPDWASGLPLATEGGISPCFKK